MGRGFSCLTSSKKCCAQPHYCSSATRAPSATAVTATTWPAFEAAFCGEFGAQPPIERLRLRLDRGGLFDRAKRFWKDVEESAMGAAAADPPPAGAAASQQAATGMHPGL